MSLTAVDLTTIYILAMDIVVCGFLLEVFKRAGAGLRLRLVLGLIFAAWITLLYLGIEGKWLFPSDIGSATFFIIVLIGATTVTAAMLLIEPLKKYLFATSQEILLLLQGLRMFLGAGWLIEATLGIMPPYFGIADGVTHITAAFLAMKAAILHTNGDKNRGAIWFANLFGLLDIVVVATGIAFVLLQDIGPYHNVMYAVFFAAPLFIGLHVVSMLKLIQAKK